MLLRHLCETLHAVIHVTYSIISSCTYTYLQTTNIVFMLCISLRVESLTEEDILAIDDDHMILKPIKFSCHVTRLLSSWCKEIPAIDVGADLGALEVGKIILRRNLVCHRCSQNCKIPLSMSQILLF